MEQEMINRHMNVLMEMVDMITDECPYAVVREMDWEVDEGKEELLLKLTLNTGTSDYNFKMNWAGRIYSISKGMPKHMIADIHNAVCAEYLSQIYQELKSRRQDGLPDIT